MWVNITYTELVNGGHSLYHHHYQYLSLPSQVVPLSPSPLDAASTNATENNDTHDTQFGATITIGSSHTVHNSQTKQYQWQQHYAN